MTRKRLVLGELEAAVLDALWRAGDATVAEVTDALPDDGSRHYNTVATVLTRLSARGLVARRKDGRSHVFRACVTRDDLGREYLELLRRDLFGGSVGRLVAALAPTRRRRSRLAADLRRLADEIERGEARDG